MAKKTSTRRATQKVNITKNYRLFERSRENRTLDLKKHRKLQRSMERYGFLSCFPIVCFRNGDKHLVVKDGQHRLALAESLGLPVYWIEDHHDFDVAIVNSAAKVWNIKDYALKYAENGKKAYQEGLEFSDQFGIPVGKAFALLAGVTSYGNVQQSYVDGTFRIKDRKWADAVASIYSRMVLLSHSLKNVAFLDACMSVCRVSDFDAKRLIANAERQRDKLLAYSTKDAYLDMLEEIYNYNRSKMVGLKVAAMMAMRDRAAVEPTNGAAVKK